MAPLQLTFSEFESQVRMRCSPGGFFNREVPLFISRAPGRLDLMGGNDDYTGGLVFETTIREATFAAAQPSADAQVYLLNQTAAVAGWPGECEITLSEIRDLERLRQWLGARPELRWTAYVLGNLHFLLTRFPEKANQGLRLYMNSSVPLNRGVSSSAAIEVAVMKASAAAFGIELQGPDLALACQWVENVVCDSACGIMDQITVVLGKEDQVLPLVCQPCLPESLVQLPAELKVWGIDSGVSHQVSGIEYEAARAAAFMGYKMICDWEKIEVKKDTDASVPRYTDPRWKGYLANMPLSLFTALYQDRLPVSMFSQEFLDVHQFHADPFTPLRDGVRYHVQANTRYAVEENLRVQLFCELSRAASLNPSPRVFELMGDLMYQSHHAYTQCGLGAEATDRLVGLCRQRGPAQGIYGAKITGGGAGGTVALLAARKAKAVVEEIYDQYEKLNFGKPYLFEGSSDGADAFGIRRISFP